MGWGPMLAVGLLLLWSFSLLWAEDTSVHTAAELQAALENTNASRVLLAASIRLEGFNWQPVQIGRPVSLSGAHGIFLDLHGLDTPMFDYTASGSLEMANITIANFFPENGTYNLSDGPVPCLRVSSGARGPLLVNVILYTVSTLEDLKSRSAWWGENGPSGSASGISHRAPISTPSNSSYPITSSHLIFKAGTVCPLGAFVSTPAELKSALRNSNLSNITLVNSMVLLRDVFSGYQSDTVVVQHDVVIYACSGEVILDLDFIKDGVSVNSSVLLQGPWKVKHSKAARRQNWRYDFSLLLSLFHVEPPGIVTLKGIEVEAADFQSIKARVKSVDAGSEAILVKEWDDVWWVPPDTSNDGFMGPLTSPIAHKGWRFENVTVLKGQESCGGLGVKASNSHELLSYLTEKGFANIEITQDIKLDLTHTVNGKQLMDNARTPYEGLGINVTQPVVIRACRNDGQRYVLDFNSYVNLIFVFGKLTFLGDLTLTGGLPMPRRGLVWELVSALSVEEDGIVEFEDVVMENAQKSPMHDFYDFWWSYNNPGFQPKRGRDVYLVNQSDTYINNWRFYKSPWVMQSQTNANSDIRPVGDGYWSYVDVISRWTQAPAAKDQDELPILVIVLPVVLGSMALAAAGLTVWMWARYKRQQRKWIREAQDEEKVRKEQEDDMERSSTKLSSVKGSVKGTNNTEMRIEAAKQVIAGAARNLQAAGEDELQLEQLLGQGTFGKVYKGTWRGTLVAVKTMVFPASMSGREKREKMAIMETAISSSLSHPNVVQTYTYTIEPIHDRTGRMVHSLDPASSSASGPDSTSMFPEQTPGVHSWEVRLVLEYCDRGSLRDYLNEGGLRLPDGQPDFLVIVDTALDIAKAMVHLHRENIIHSDLKARNILLKSSGLTKHGFIAKVADFGLSVRLDHDETHISEMYQGTMTHMPPEALIWGRVGPASDVYAFGILMWELYTGNHAFRGIPKALLAHEITEGKRRPKFPETCPFDYMLLAWRCWETDPGIRPTFSAILEDLNRTRAKYFSEGDSQPLASGLIAPERNSLQEPGENDKWETHGAKSRWVTLTQDTTLGSSDYYPHGTDGTKGTTELLDVVIVGTPRIAGKEVSAVSHEAEGNGPGVGKEMGSRRSTSSTAVSHEAEGSGTSVGKEMGSRRSTSSTEEEVKRSFEMRRELGDNGWVDPQVKSLSPIESQEDNDDRAMYKADDSEGAREVAETLPVLNSGPSTTLKGDEAASP